jgi:hypothetical protein
MNNDSSHSDFSLPVRTNATSLTNDELLILDFAFTPFCMPVSQLYTEAYSFHMNTRYSHSLSDSMVISTLDSFVKAGLLEREEIENEEQNYWTRNNPDVELYSWCLAKTGGHLWELERRPIWDRYVESSSGPYPRPDDGPDSPYYYDEDSGFINPVLTVMSPSQRMAELYLETRLDLEPEIARTSERVDIVKKNCDELCHKIFPEVHFIIIPIVSEISGQDLPTNITERKEWWRIEREKRDERERRRVWWDTVAKLDSLRKKLGLND